MCPPSQKELPQKDNTGTLKAAVGVLSVSTIGLLAATIALAVKGTNQQPAPTQTMATMNPKEDTKAPATMEDVAAKAPSGDFLEFAMKTLEEINEQICKQDEGACEEISQLVAAGEKYKVLPSRIHVNYRAMTIAYSTVFQESPFFLEAMRFHRALGLGNAQLFQGYSENVVNELYWSHYNRLAILDKDVQPLGDGIETYCEYIADEYQALKDFALANYGENVFANAPTFDQNQMLPWCLGLDDGSPSVSYIVRNDWEHHRAEVVGSMMNSAYTEMMVTHTILHWESLFAAGTGFSVPLLFESFGVFLQEQE